MSDSDDRPDIDEQMEGAVRDLTPDVEKLLEQGQVLLTGPASVQFMVRVEECATPQEAVEKVIRQIAHIGMDAFTFAVTDTLTGENYFVQGGQLLDLDEVEKTIERADEDEQT